MNKCTSRHSPFTVSSIYIQRMGMLEGQASSERVLHSGGLVFGTLIMDKGDVMEAVNVHLRVEDAVADETIWPKRRRTTTLT